MTRRPAPRARALLPALALSAAAVFSTAAHSKTLVYCSEGSPENFAPALNTTGTSFEYLLATAKMESNFNPTAGASTSSARGLFQFIDQTWLGTVKEAGAQLGYGKYADAISKSGLSGLTLFLAQRTALEAGEPVALDIARDELNFYPLIYWPVVPNAAKPTPEALARIRGFTLRTAGTAAAGVLFVMLVQLLRTAPQLPAAAGAEGTVESIGRLLFGDYLLPFELTSFLILAAIVGAVTLAKQHAPK